MAAVRLPAAATVVALMVIPTVAVAATVMRIDHCTAARP